jgi:hypothetical protein
MDNVQECNICINHCASEDQKQIFSRPVWSLGELWVNGAPSRAIGRVDKICLPRAAFLRATKRIADKYEYWDLLIRQVCAIFVPRKECRLNGSQCVRLQETLKTQHARDVPHPSAQSQWSLSAAFPKIIFSSVHDGKENKRPCSFTPPLIQALT